MKSNLLLNRLIQFSNHVYDVCSSHGNKPNLTSLLDQIDRSSTSAALNYGEAIVSGSDRDYANKVRIAIKEMNETCTSLKLLKARVPIIVQKLEPLETESGELLAMLHACCQKAESKFKK
jgi:four helix bundle protein